MRCVLRRCRRSLWLLAVVTLYSSACGKLEGANATPSGLGVGEAVDPNAGFATPSLPDGTATPSSPVTTNQLASPNHSVGIAIRWRADASKCLSRQSVAIVDGDPLVVVPCAADDRQAFTYLAGRVYAGPQAFVGFGQDANIAAIRTSTVYALTWSLQASTTYLTRPSNNQTTPYLWADANQSGGTMAAQLTRYGYGDSSRWDFTSVSATEGGTLLSVNGNSRFCLVKIDSQVALATCDQANAAHRWSFVDGNFINDAGGYLQVDLNASPPTLKLVTSQTSTNDYGLRWETTGGTFLFWSDSGRTSYLLSADPNTRQAFADTSANGVTWVFGGLVINK